jgi:hypothetical protein
MRSRALFVSLLAFSFSVLSFASTAPLVTVVSPVAVSSGGVNSVPYNGPSPVHFVGWATSTDCPAGIYAMRVYSSTGVLAYATRSSFIDEVITMAPGSYASTVEVTDNCGGTSSVNLQENVQAATGQIIVTQPISNLPYEGGGLGLTVNAVSTTTCAQGVNYMSMSIDGNQVARRKGNFFEAGPKLGVGTYNASISETDNCGGSTSVPLTIVIQKTGLSWQMGNFGFAYMPSATTGTIQEFYVPTTNCSLTPVFGNPAPAGKRPWATSRMYPYLFVLNEASSDLSVYYMDLNVSGELIQIPGSPFPLGEAPGYTPTGVAVPGTESITGNFVVYITNTSSDGQPGTLSQLTLNVPNSTITPLAPPYVLHGNVQPMGIYIGAEDSSGGHFLLTNNGSSFSVLDGYDYEPRYEDIDSPVPVPGLYGPSAGVTDMTMGVTGTPSNIYTANSEGSISGFLLTEYGQVTQLPGSPYANPDHAPGSSGNPASVTLYTNFSTGSYLYLLNAGAHDVGIFSVNNDTGVPTYMESRQKGLINALSTDKIRAGGGIGQTCLVTSSGYSMLLETSGLTELEPGSPFWGPGLYPTIDLAPF